MERAVSVRAEEVAVGLEGVAGRQALVAPLSQQLSQLSVAAEVLLPFSPPIPQQNHVDLDFTNWKTFQNLKSTSLLKLIRTK